MKSKKKLLISLLVVAFAIVSVVGVIAIVFALSQQTIKTSLNIRYKAVDIYGTVSGTYTVGTTVKDLTASTGGTTLVFDGDTESLGSLNLQENELNLTAENPSVVLHYTFTNTGSVNYSAIMSYAETLIFEDNMVVEYSLDGVNYSTEKYGIVVTKDTPESYWIRIRVEDTAFDASFEADFSWLLENFDLVAEDALNYKENKDGTYTVSYNGEDLESGTLYIPNQVGSASVVAISQNSSLTEEQKAQVKKVAIFEGVDTIGYQAFKGFNNITDVYTIKDDGVSTASVGSTFDIEGITSIGYGGFESCKSLTRVVLPSTLQTMGNRAFINCSALQELEIKESELTSIGTIAFQSTNLKNITIPNTITSISSDAFNSVTGLEVINIDLTDCTHKLFDIQSIKEISFGKNVKTIQTLSLPNLERINVDAENTNYLSENGCFVDKTAKTILRVLPINGADPIIPDDGSVETIGAYTFANLEINNLTLPNSIKTVDSTAFENTKIVNLSIDMTTLPDVLPSGDSIKSLTLGENVQTININTLLSLGELETISANVNNSTFKTQNGCLINKTTKVLVKASGNNPVIPTDGSVTSIGEYAFNGAWIEELTITNVISNIHETSFEDCRVGKMYVNLTTIPAKAFTNADFENVYISSTNSTIGEGAFENVTADFYVAASSKSGEWSLAANRVVYNFGSAHTCQFETATNYMVENGSAYTYNKCKHCDNIGNKTLLANSIVATPETIQSILDTDVNGKTVVLAPGRYDDNLYLRASKATSKAFAYKGSEDPHTCGEEVAIADLDKTKTTRYHYTRDISNLTITGTTGAILTGRFIVYPRLLWNLSASEYELWDAVREIESKTYGQHMDIENLTFDSLRFKGLNGRINVTAEVAIGETSIKNLTIQNCKFTANIEEVLLSETNLSAMSINTTLVGELASGVNIKNNLVKGMFQGVASYGMSNMLFDGNKFVKNEAHGIMISQYSSEVVDRGYITITNNIIDTCYDSAYETGDFLEGGHYTIRIHRALDTEITISGNYLGNCFKRILYASSMEGCSYTVEGNYYNNVSFEDSVTEVFDETEFSVFVKGYEPVEEETVTE